MTILTDWAVQTWNVLAAAAPWLLGGFLLAGLVHVLFPTSVLTRHLGRPGLSGVLKASLFGIPLPLCSCSVIPVASSLRRQGASRGAFASFLVSTPETGVDSIAITYSLLGPFLTVVRPLAAFVTAMVAGLLVGSSDGGLEPGEEAVLEESENAGASCCSSCCAEEAESKDRGRVLTAIHYGLVEMITDLSPWLVSGFLLAGLVAAIIPDGFLERYVGAGFPAMMVMLVVGLPMYVCSTSSTPIAAALIARGLSPGAALVFLLVGPATNIATMMVVFRDLGRRGLMVYLGSIAVIAVLFGLVVDKVLPSLPVSIAVMPPCVDHATSNTAWPMAVAFVLLTLNGLRLRLTAGRRR
jgi:uncharacterized membrane protein YraQ (UPF0718 family)